MRSTLMWSNSRPPPQRRKWKQKKPRTKKMIIGKVKEKAKQKMSYVPGQHFTKFVSPSRYYCCSFSVVQFILPYNIIGVFLKLHCKAWEREEQGYQASASTELGLMLGCVHHLYKPTSTTTPQVSPQFIRKLRVLAMDARRNLMKG